MGELELDFVVLALGLASGVMIFIAYQVGRAKGLTEGWDEAVHLWQSTQDDSLS